MSFIEIISRPVDVTYTQLSVLLYHMKEGYIL